MNKWLLHKFRVVHIDYEDTTITQLYFAKSVCSAKECRYILYEYDNGEEWYDQWIYDIESGTISEDDLEKDYEDALNRYLVLFGYRLYTEDEYEWSKIK